MAEVHLFQWVVAFAAALWLTVRWLLTRPQSRWRHIISGIVSTLLWIPVAYTAGNVHVATDAGETVAFGSEALGTFAIFMAVVCIAGLLLGLVLWTEEEAQDMSEALPRRMQRGPGDD